MMLEILFILLPVAAFTGWSVGRRRLPSYRKLEKLMGLTDFLSRRPEKSAAAVIEWLDANQESVETHLTLGNLFRRRGEVDKAIGIHQNLITKSSLTEPQKALSLLELSRDYMQAGVLDRAEHVLKELVNKGLELETSFLHLIDIYQQSKEWLRAIETAEKLEQATHRDMSRHRSHFYCELAQQLWLKGEKDSADIYLKRAYQINHGCVRASLLTGDMAANAGHYKAAIKAYEQVQKQDQAFLSEIVTPLARCYEKLGNPEGLVKYLTHCLNTNPNLSVVLAYSDWLSKTEGEEKAIKFVIEHLQVHPSIRGLSRVMQFNLARVEGALHDDLKILQELMDKVIAHKPLYRCEACGFSGRTLQWQCPGCKRWDVIKPIHE